jgi:CxxC motif-containing protein (DUF1111 family)
MRAAPGCALLLAATLAGAALGAVLDDRPGGDTTVEARGRRAFSLAAANLAPAEHTRFAIGNSFFRRNWVAAPASTRARDGLGPLFNARSCSGCHVNDGRAAPGEPGLLLRLSVPGQDAQGGPLPEPRYGLQLATQALPGWAAEGRLQRDHDSLSGQFADGTRYALQRPRYRIDAPAYGPLDAALQTSPRIAPQLIGLGLLEAIAEADIEANAAAQAARGDAIRGQPNRVWDAPSGQLRIGRFGWKANAATLAHQTAAAFSSDMGITSSVFPAADCSPAQPQCATAPSGGSPEIDDRTLADVVFYTATLAPPERRDAAAADVQRGRQLFEQARCAVCHRPSYVTQAAFPPLRPAQSPALAGQAIHPYTDLLLHDMGEALADGRPDFLASGRQWRTPPLWGVGLIEAVNGHQRLLHDGRARGVLEAVLWHGGEAQASRDQVLAMTAAEREALKRFVESL